MGSRLRSIPTDKKRGASAYSGYRPGVGNPQFVLIADRIPNACICTWEPFHRTGKWALKYMNLMCLDYRDHLQVQKAAIAENEGT